MLAVRFLILALGLLAGWVAGQAIPDAAEPSVTLVNTLSLMLAGLLLAVLRLAVAGRLRERDGKVQLDGHPLLNPLQLDCAGDDALHDSSNGVA